jgi:arylsulfatase A-like enzyme
MRSGPIPKLLALGCAFTGLALPISYFVSFSASSRYLGPQALIFLYGSEWLFFLVQGVIAVIFASAGYALAAIFSHPDRGQATINVTKTVVIGICFAFAISAWLKSLPVDFSVELRWRHTLLLGIFFGIAGLKNKRVASILNRALNTSIIATIIGAIFYIYTLGHELSRAHPAAENKILSGSFKNNKKKSLNIVLITIDTLNASHTTPLRSDRNTSPELEKLSGEGIFFSNFHSNSNFTTPSISSIHSGATPWTHRTLQLMASLQDSTTSTSIAEWLKKTGYETSYFGSNPAAGANRLGLGKSFTHEHSDVKPLSLCNDEEQYPWQWCAATQNSWIAESLSVFQKISSYFGIDEPNFRASIRINHRLSMWKEYSESKPQFVWIHYFSPHDPYATTEPWLGSFNPSSEARNFATSSPTPLFSDRFTSPSRIEALRDRYDESISEVDFHLGEAVELLKRKLGPNTAFLITADHGESFSHGYGGHTGPMLYEDLIHIPLIIQLPNGQRAGTRIDAPASQIDLAPTIADIAGIAPDPSWEGRSLLSGEPIPEDRPIYSMNFEENPARGKLTTGSIALIRNHWKLVRFFGNLSYPDMPKLKTQLFDLRADAQELHNLATERPDVVRELSSVMDAEFAKHSGPVPPDDRAPTR